MAARKIVCLGGGSCYFGRTLGDLVTAPDLGGGEIVLYDIDQDRCARVLPIPGAGRGRAEPPLRPPLRRPPQLADAKPDVPVPSGAERDERRVCLEGFERDLGEIGLPPPNASSLDGEGLGVLLSAIATGRRHVHIVNVPKQGVIPNLPDYAIVEVESVTDSQGVRPIYTGDAPLALQGIPAKRIACQEFVVDAGVKGDCNLARQALLVDEMAVLPERAEAMLGELLAGSRGYLPQFR